MAWPSLRLVSALRTDLVSAQIGVSLRETHEQGGNMHREGGLWHTSISSDRVPQWRRDGVQAARVYHPATRARR